MPSSFKLTVGLAAVATVVATALRLIESYDHGIWLVAYLLLVGTVAQYLLARGQAELAPEAPHELTLFEALLWSIGVITVPLGVFVDVRILVAVGSAALLAALFLFWRTTRPAGTYARRGSDRSGFINAGYTTLLVFMVISVFVGLGLASDVPWI